MKKLVLALVCCISIGKLISQQVYPTCGNLTVAITATNSSGLTNPQYSVNPGGLLVTGPSFTLPAAAGTYTLYTTGLNSTNQSTTQLSLFSIQTVLPPQIAISTNSQNCNDQTATITSTVSGNGVSASNITWSPLPTAGPVAGSIWTFAAPNTTALVTAVVTDSFGCVASATTLLAPAKLGHNVNLLFPNGSNITCSQPSVNLVVLPTYPLNPAALKYTYSGPLQLPGLPSVFISTPGTYTLNVMDTLTTCNSLPMVFSIGVNTVAFTRTMSPITQTITCNSTVQTVTISTSGSPSFCRIALVSPSTATTIANSSSAFYSPGAPGIYTCVVTNKNNGCTTSGTFQVIGSGFPTFSLTSLQNYTLGCSSKSVATVNFVGATTSPPGGPVNMAITAGSNGPFPPTNTISNVFTTPGNYTALVYDVGTSCFAYAPFTISSNTTAPSYTMNAVPVMNCTLSSVVLQPTIAVGNSLVWQLPQGGGTSSLGIIQVSANPVATQSVAGAYTLTVTDGDNACKTTTTLLVLQNRFQPTANFSTGTANGITCGQPSITLVNISTSGIPAGSPFPNSSPVVGYLWQGPVPQQSATLLTTYMAYTPGVYTLTALDLNNACTATATTAIFDDRDYPVVTQPSFPLTLPCPFTGQYSINPEYFTPLSFFSYSWTSSPPTLLFTSIGTAISITNPGFYIFSAKNNVSQCVTTVTFAVYACVGFDENNTDSFSVFPSPCKDQLRVALPESTGQRTLTIYNSLAEIVFKNQATESFYRIDMSAFGAGVYYIAVEGDAKLKSIKKIIKE